MPLRLLRCTLFVLALGACNSTEVEPDGGATCGTGVSDEAGVVITKAGPVRGVVGPAGTAYRGIPFAKPPVGDLRWQPPEKLDCSRVEIDASAFGNTCVQRGPDGAMQGFEDCLTLNVWTPPGATSLANLPVMVFIHGGGNMNGSASAAVSGVQLYDGQTLAERGGVVVVTLQYRLNIFGYLMHPELALESAHGVSGNYALLDQLAGLAWVQDNIAVFGGDPHRVLLFGESGGATDVCALVASPLGAGLFSSAMIQSGSCAGRERGQVEQWGRDFLGNTSCAGSAAPLACLRSLPPDEITAAVPGGGGGAGVVVAPAGPTIDGYVVPEHPSAAFAAGHHNKVPVVVGVNAEETASQLFGIPSMTETEYQTRVRMQFGATRGDQVLARYPAASFASPRWAYVAVTTDLQFVCPARQYARALMAGQTAPVYRYLYSNRLSGPSAALGAAHGLELFYVFQAMSRIPGYAPSANDLALEQAMLAYWTRLASMGDPNGADTPTWPAYDAQDPYLELAKPPTPGMGMRTALCDFWEP